MKKKHVCNGPRCDHREPQKGNWMRVKDPGSFDRRSEDMMPVPDHEQLEALANRLLGFGLKPWEVEVLLQRDVLKLKLSDIAEQGGYTSSGAVYKVYRSAAAKARLAYKGSTDA